MDRMSLELDIERRKADPTEPTVPGPVTDDTQRAYNADYSYAASHQAVDPSTLTNLNTRWVDNITPGNDANPGTMAAPVRTLQQGITLAAGGGFPYVACKGTFRTRAITTADVRIVGWPGFIPIWEAPDTYPTAVAPTAPGAPVAFRPSFGGYNVTGTSFHYIGGSWNINSSHTVPLIAPNWSQAATSTWSDHGGIVRTPTTVKRMCFDPRLGGLPLAFVAAALGVSGGANYRATYFQKTGLDAIPDSNVNGSPTNVVNSAYSNWDITTVDVCYGKESFNQLVALNHNIRNVGTFHESLVLYGARTNAPNWEVLDELIMTTGVSSSLGYFLFPANVNASILSSPFDWHTLRSCNGRYYLLQPHASTAGNIIRIINPLMAWDQYGTRLTFEPPQLTGQIGGVTYVRTRTCDIEFYKGLYYLTTDTGIYASEDGLTGWVPVLNNGNLVPRFLHICNGVLFCSADRSSTSAYGAGETRMLYTFDGITWNYYTVPENYSGEVFSLGGCIVGICNIVASIIPYLYFQEPMLWNKNTAITNFDIHVENFDIQVRRKCSGFDGDWFGAGA